MQQTNKQLLARIILKCFHCTPRSLLIVGDVTFLGIDFDKAPTTPWTWFTYAFAWLCALFTVIWALAYACRLLHLLYYWAEDNE